MKVILTADVDKLGKSGEMKDVADGYARNYLIPRKLAVPAAGGAYRAWQHDIASREEKRRREREEAEIAANRISSTTLTMGVKVGEGGKLYGSITAKDIADALGRRGIVVDRHKIELDEPLKSLGTYKVAVKVLAGMTPEVTVVVEPEGLAAHRASTLPPRELRRAPCRSAAPRARRSWGGSTSPPRRGEAAVDDSMGSGGRPVAEATPAGPLTARGMRLDRWDLGLLQDRLVQIESVPSSLVLVGHCSSRSPSRSSTGSSPWKCRCPSSTGSWVC